MPVGLFLAIMLALGRLYHESEMAAMQACGLGFADLYKPIAVLTVLVVALLSYLAFVASPAAFARAQDIRADAVRQAQLAGLDAGRFRSFANGEVVFYAESVDDNGILHNVFVERAVGDKVEMVIAARAEQRGIGEEVQTLVLYEGQRYEGSPGEGEFRIVQFSEHGIPVRMPATKSQSDRRERKPTSELMGSADLADQAELQSRISFPLMTIVLTLIAVPLARLKPRQGRYGKMALAFLIYFIYAMGLNAAKPWVEKGTVPTAIGLWWVHGLMLMFGLILLLRANPMRRMRSPRTAAVSP
jgi:lipopolysaccharide export system permease protein